MQVEMGVQFLLEDHLVTQNNLILNTKKKKITEYSERKQKGKYQVQEKEKEIEKEKKIKIEIKTEIEIEVEKGKRKERSLKKW